MENSELCGENKKSENEKKESGLSTEETLEQINSEMNSTEKKTLTLVDSSSSDDVSIKHSVTI